MPVKRRKPKRYITKKSLPVFTFHLILIFTVLNFTNIVYAQTYKRKTIEGIWQGTLKFEGIELGIIFTISQKPGSTLSATMDVPEQGATGVAVDSVIFDGSTLRMELTQINGNYKGLLSENGKKFEGDWTQGGMSLPLVLEHKDTKSVFIRPQEPKEPFPYRIEEVIINNTSAGIRLVGTLTMPSSKRTFPAVLLLSGSGPQDRDETVFGHRPFLVLADYLTREGIAVLRVDDRGVSGSTGDFDKANAMDYVSDAIACVKYLNNRKEINHELIGLIGHSEGGMIAPLVALQMPDIAFIVSIASPGLPIVDMEYSELIRTLKAKGADDNLIAKSCNMKEKLFEVIKNETDSVTVMKKFKTIITEFFVISSKEERKITGLSEENLDAYINNEAKRLHSTWFRFYLPYDPGIVLRKIKCPVLAVNGEKDVQVLSKENLRAIERALKAGENDNYLIKELPDLNHLLQTAETGAISEYGKIEETMSPSALRIIGDWILKQIKTR
ncbi:alpha/beta hydrolase family protein [candidate division KSB1 bacterium]